MNAQTTPREQVARHVENILGEYDEIERLLEDHSTEDTNVLKNREQDMLFTPIGRLREAHRLLTQ